MLTMHYRTMDRTETPAPTCGAAAQVAPVLPDVALHPYRCCPHHKDSQAGSMPSPRPCSQDGAAASAASATTTRLDVVVGIAIVKGFEVTLRVGENRFARLARLGRGEPQGIICLLALEVADLVRQHGGGTFCNRHYIHGP